MEKLTAGRLLTGVKIPARYDARKHYPAFETIRHARNERLARIEHCRRRNPVDRQITRLLRRCGPGRRCARPVCPVCTRRFQIRLIAEVLQAFQPYPEVWHTTILARRWCVKPGRLGTIKLRTIKSTLQTQLKRCGLGHCVAAGSVEIVFKPAFDRWVIHIHLMLAGASKTDIENSLGLYYPDFKIKVVKPLSAARSSGKPAPLRMLIDAVDVRGGDKLTAPRISYQFKLKTWQEEWILNTVTGKPYKRKSRPPKHIHSEHMHYFAQHEHRDFVLLQRLKLSPQLRLCPV